MRGHFSLYIGIHNTEREVALEQGLEENYWRAGYFTQQLITQP